MISLIVLGVVFFMSVEAMFWAFSINRHSYWLKLHPDYDRRLAVPARILGTAGLMTACMSIFIWMWAVYNFTLYKGGACNACSYYTKSFLAIWMQLSMIHLWGIIARYSCLHTQYWPILSGMVSRFLIRHFKMTDLSNYCNSMRKWSDLDKLSRKHKSLIFKFADKVIDLFWTKDEKKRYTYINQSRLTDLLMLDKFDSLGLTHKEIAEKLRSEGIEYYYDSESVGTDDIVLYERRTVRFIAKGVIKGKDVVVYVTKSPIFQNGEVVGIIGMGRDITFETVALEKIELLFRSGEIEKGIAEFYKQKEEFSSMERFKLLEEN